MSSEDVVATALEVGNKQFKLQKYDECVKIYSKAIELVESLSQKTILKLRKSYGLTERPAYLKQGENVNHPKLLTLLDNRAAAYEKLQNYQQAVQDSQRAVSIEPFNAKGYIRMGKLMLFMKKETKAYEVFSKGVKRIEYGVTKYGIKVNPNLLQHLKAQKQQLTSKLNEQKAQVKESERYPDIKRASESLVRSVSGSSQERKRAKTSSSLNPKGSSQLSRSFDLLLWLPIEIITHIFSHLPLKDVLNCLLVSPEWNHTLSRIPALFNNISISRFASLKQVQSCFSLLLKSRRSSHIKALDHFRLHSIRRTDERQILNFILNKSSICFTGDVDFSFLDVTTEQLVDCLKRNSVALRKLETLKHLKLSCVLVPTAEESLLELLPNLESFELIRVPDNKRPSTLRRYQANDHTFPNLKKLTLVGDIKSKYPSIPFFDHFLNQVQSFPNLKSLTIVGYDFQTLNTASREFNFLQNLPKLQSLVFENNDNFNLSTFFKSHDLLEFKELKKFALREREIRYSEHLMHYDSFYLSRIFQNLRILDLTGSSITWQGLSKILKVCGSSLQQLSIGYCQNVIFKKGPFRVHVNGGFFDFENFFKWCPNLQVLYLNQSTDFNDYSLTQMVTALKQQELFKNLKLLDLSFNEVSGYKLLDLVKVLKIESLILHGLDIHTETIKLMESSYCKKVESRIDKQSWREYGINSYNPF
ncbi:hypothetical protein WICANDRAFT_60401 [Wickerhamomyces anomalus NRRL Y-366-8]|uniref:F-box domain-containing protein n=1 Tax=Wickerhamomyces anomalus (strain ATCC 58044 / CBS 1984 / NCYC 433 / NRRL Y-366-8) TaxID=683960 RepID=A0A1E3PAL8_WICAA|nr:uncharacterized protein WICANDRAFT_60401 [Wickerhamomyces anomalus NRRL Y-366-8]ODQ62340.1 hypothetical protein WICANDRAFT_60401 [Wickerhamomyces anomalus NRRL Y-366-8]